jgi:8-oxo-dGTP pyrophosphatase MutT (NUDIX family)
MSGEPIPPRPAAAIILLRRSGRHREAGLEVLLARRTGEARFMPGVWVFPGGAVDRAELEGDDEELAHRECAARELAEEAGVELAAGAELVPFSRWITPEAVPVRFDTRFYLALAPPHSSPRADAREITEVAWFKPSDALDRHGRDELKLVFPTIKDLEAMREHATAEELLAAAREQGVRKILPKVLGTRDDFRVVLPGDPDYPED